MAYEIEKHDGYFEVRVSGETSKSEVLQVVRLLERQDPRKEVPDLWLIAEECQIPFHDFSKIAQAIGHLLPRGVIGSRTAIVAANAFHQAQLGMYPAEATNLPFPIRVFGSHEDAVAWIKSS